MQRYALWVKMATEKLEKKYKQDWKTSVLKPEDKTVMTENGCFCDFYDFYDFYEF